MALAAAMPNQVYQGWLTKEPLRGGMFSQARQRYFILDEESLSWHKDAYSPQAKGSLPLAGAELVRAGQTLRLTSAGGPTLVLRADKTEDLDLWHTAIRAELDKLPGVGAGDEGGSPGGTGELAAPTAGRAGGGAAADVAVSSSADATARPGLPVDTRAALPDRVELTASTSPEPSPPTGAPRMPSPNRLPSTGEMLGYDHEQAALVLREAVEKSEDERGRHHPQTLVAINNYSRMLQAKGEHEEARALALEVLDARRAALGPEHPGTLVAMSNYGRLLQEQGRLDEAEPILQRVLALRRKTLGESHPGTLAAIGNYGGLLKELGRLRDAEPYFREDVETSRATLGESHPDTLIALGNLVDVMRERGHHDDARETLGDAVALARKVFGADHMDTLIMEAKAARLAHAAGSDGGLAELTAAVERMEALLGFTHPQSAKYREVLTQIAGAPGQKSAAPDGEVGDAGVEVVEQRLSELLVDLA